MSPTMTYRLATPGGRTGGCGEGCCMAIVAPHRPAGPRRPRMERRRGRRGGAGAGGRGAPRGGGRGAGLAAATVGERAARRRGPAVAFSGGGLILRQR